MVVAFLKPFAAQSTLTKALAGLHHDENTNVGGDYRSSLDHADVRVWWREPIPDVAFTVRPLTVGADHNKRQALGCGLRDHGWNTRRT